MGLLRFIVGAALGYGIGWAAGRFYAPESGDQLRLELKHRYDQIASEAERAGEAKRIEMQGQFERAKSSRAI